MAGTEMRCQAWCDQPLLTEEERTRQMDFWADDDESSSEVIRKTGICNDCVKAVQAEMNRLLGERLMADRRTSRA